MSDSTLLKIQVTPLQFSDRGRRAVHDIDTLFEAGKNFPVKILTEVGPETDLREELQDQLKKRNHRAAFYRSNAVLIDRDIIKQGSWRKGAVFVEDNDNVFGPGHDSGFAWASFIHKTPGVGRISVAGFHYPTKGRYAGDPNHWVNKKYAYALADWAEQHGEGDKIVIGGGDSNMPDGRTNWAFGRQFTTLADELAARAKEEDRKYKYQNTGHSDIDGIWTWNPDGRVEAVSFTVLDDRELRMNSDHFVSRGTIRIRHIDAPRSGADPVPEIKRKTQVPEQPKQETGPLVPPAINLEVPKTDNS